MKFSLRRAAEPVEVRSTPTLSFDDWAQLVAQMSFQGVNYTMPQALQEEVGGTFSSLARAGYKSNGVIFACMATRSRIFAQGRFQFQRLRNGQPTDFFGTPELKLLETPWPGGTTGDLLSKMLQHADLAGNAFIVRAGGRPGVTLLRPDWVKIIVATGDPEGDNWDVDAEVKGYMYQPGGPGSGREPVFFLPEQVAHFAPIPDPEARFRGMSWLTPIVRELMADKAMTEHKLKFMENAATPNLAVKLAVPDLEKFSAWIDKFEEGHASAANAYRTMYLGAGADVTVLGMDMKQMDFKVTQGAGETRIAAAAGIAPIIVGLSEGLESATYSNYGQARRATADTTMWDLWQNAAGSLARIVTVPADASLAVDTRGMPFLREDSKDVAEIKVQQSLAIKQLVEGGFTPKSAVAAITSDDLTLLEHTGMVSVQLLPPGTQKNPDPPATPAAKPPARSEERDQQLGLNDININFHDGAFSVPAAEAPTVNINERAVVVEAAPAPPPAEVNVTVEAAEAPKVEFAERSIVVESPPPAEVNVTVEAGEAPKVEFAERAIVVEPARVDVTVEAPAPAEPARVEFADGAIRVEAAAAPDVSVNVTPELTATLELGDRAAEVLQPNVTVNVEPTPVTVENTVNVPETPVTVNLVDEAEGPLDVEFKRDPQGRIKSARITEEGE